MEATEARSAVNDDVWNAAIKAAADRVYHSMTPLGSPIGWNRTDRMRAQMAADAANAVMRLLGKAPA